MTDVGEFVRIREPAAASFETIINHSRPIKARFLIEFISALELFATSQQCTLVLDAIETGSIKMRWKIAIGALLSANALSVAADASQVTGFMISLWQNATEQKADKPVTPLSKALCNAIEDGTIDSITIHQDGGRTLTIDRRTYRKLDPEAMADFLKYGAGMITMLPEDMLEIAPPVTPKTITGIVHVIDGRPYFQAEGGRGFLPVDDQRDVREEWVNGARYGLFAHRHEVGPGQFIWIVLSALKA